MARPGVSGEIAQVKPRFADLMYAMRIECSKQAGVELVRPQGLLVGADADALESKVQQLFDAGGREVIIDMSGIALVDSCGLETLLNLAERQIRNGRSLKLAGATPVLQEVLELTELAPLFQCYRDVEAAVEGMA